MSMSRREMLVAGTAAAVTVLTGLKATAGVVAGKTQKPFDVVIVGGGSAGAVLAARLSADANRSVLLLEAGPNFAPDSYPPVLKNANIVAGSPAYDWHYHTDDMKRLGHDIPVPRGRVVGGSSAVNAAVAMRARPSDFARWTRRGIDSWSWDDVLPAYKAMENTPSGDDAWHGRTGPLPIRQRTAEEDTPSMRAFVEGSQALGLKHVADLNGADPHGVGFYALNVVDGVRINTGMAYLTAAVRARPNLTIRGEAEVDSVVIERKRSVGVRLVDGEFIPAGEVILASGAFGSPAILMRSGIGPVAHLVELGIPTLVDLPVGNRLQDHPFFYNVYALKRNANAMTPASGAIVWTRSQGAAPDELDLQISSTHLIDPKASPTGGAIVLACAVTLPKSLGQLRLASRDPRSAPRIHYNFLNDASDLDRLVEAVRLSRRIGETAPFSTLVDHEMAPGRAVAESTLRANIVANVAAYLHPTSTVPMGSDADSTAVVDAWGKVRGVDGLRVVDASIMPEIPSAPTNVTTIMMAERIAAKIVS
ncbi:dehydrogenase (plasmid) [Burkholderia sp. JP2-270]|uniref:GMC family oxidoreductase n=1 Tax=Burkholderia sp. JP2-270 TaxID=2217913 RepID=UPI000DA34AD2|nr:GMC family oxidoreductase N-terminal domain-containing protein [Burkholderia sp. JP2-270]AWV05724.1 dehydrogenase [Burkholderia sp. JP2-270]